MIAALFVAPSNALAHRSSLTAASSAASSTKKLAGQSATRRWTGDRRRLTAAPEWRSSILPMTAHSAIDAADAGEYELRFTRVTCLQPTSLRADETFASGRLRDGAR